MQAGNLEEAVQIFTIIDGKITVEEIEAVLNFQNMDVLETILDFAPEILKEKNQIADALLQTGHEIPSRESPTLVQDFPLERLKEALSHITPKESLPIIEEANGKKYLLFFRYIMENEAELLNGEHFDKALSLGLEANELSKKLLKRLQPSALKAVLSAYPNLSFNLDLQELPLSLTREIVNNLERETLFQRLAEFPPQVADLLYEKLSEEKSRFWEEMKRISEERADIITTLVAYTPKKFRKLFLRTQGEELMEKASQVGALVELMRKGKVRNLETLKELVPQGLFSKLYLEGVPIDPNQFWEDEKVSEQPKVLQKIAREQPQAILKHIETIPITNFMKIRQDLTQEDSIEALRQMSVEEMIRIMILEEWYPKDLGIWNDIAHTYPHLGLIPQAPPTTRIKAALRLGSRPILNQIIQFVGKRAIDEKAFAVLRKSVTDFSTPKSEKKVQEFLSSGGKLTSGALVFLLYQLVTKKVAPKDIIPLIQDGGPLPTKEVLLSQLKNGSLLGFAGGIVEADHHKDIPQEDIVRAFGQPEIFEGQIKDIEINSNRISALLLEQVELTTEKKFLGKTIEVKKLRETAKEIPVEEITYDRIGEKRFIGELIMELVQRDRFSLPVFFIMSYAGEILPADYSIEELDRLNAALTKVEGSSVPELRDAVIQMEQKVGKIPRGEEEVAKEKKMEPEEKIEEETKKEEKKSPEEETLDEVDKALDRLEQVLGGKDKEDEE